MNRILFTENFVKKFDRIVDSNPVEARKLLDEIDEFAKGNREENVSKIDDDGYSFSCCNYRLLFHYKDHQITFLTILDLKNIFDLESKDDNSKKKYSFA